MTIDPATLAHYYFVPYLREGLATRIDADPEKSRAKVPVKLKAIGSTDGVEGSRVDVGPPNGVELIGPGDVLGMNDKVITRLQPQRDIGDFEPNYFPFIEFEQPDFPWRFTASMIPEDGHLKPWLTLVVLVAEDVADASQPDGVGKRKEFFEQTEFTIPALAKANAPYILVNSLEYLPYLSESWRWAHVQVTTDGVLNGDRERALAQIIQNEPDRTVSRLMCARRLRPRTLYRAFVVPTYRLGVLAGLGIPFDLDPDAKAIDLAWTDSGQVLPFPIEDVSSGASGIALPYYYTWEFRTGLRGNFEDLVKRLKPRRLTDLGIRDLDCGGPGYGPLGVVRQDESGKEVHTLGLEGALLSLGTEPTKWGQDAEDWSVTGPHDSFRLKLKELINQPKVDLDGGNLRPKIVPPIYGRWHAAEDSVDPGQVSWIHELNLDPRHRMTAGFGTKVVQEQQEELMASAWDQVGAIDEANEELGRAQIGRETSISIYEHRLKNLSLGDLIRVASPIHARVLMEEENEATGNRETVRNHIRGSRIPQAALDPALRRIARRRGPWRKQQQPDGDPNRKDMLERLNDGSLRPAGPWPDADGALNMCHISFELLRSSGLTKVAERLCPTESTKDVGEIGQMLNLFCETNLSCEAIQSIPGRPDFTGNPSGSSEKTPSEGEDSPAAAAFRNFMLELCEQLTPEEEEPELEPIDLPNARDTLIRATDPRKTIPDRIRNRLQLVDVPEQHDPLDPIMAAPEFDMPMYKPLEETSQDLLLPGLETVPQNTLGLLKTNGRFVEAFMVGLNHEMARELLWREYPTDQRGSYFRQFWDVNDYIPTDDDLSSIDSAIAELSQQDIDRVVRRNVPRVEDALDLSEADIRVLLEDDLLEKKLKDIKSIHKWKNSQLGSNDNRPESEPASDVEILLGSNDNQSESEPASDVENLVLLVRGDLLRKYPNTIIYAVQAKQDAVRGRVPGLPEYFPEMPPPDVTIESWIGEIKRPIFSGQLPPDITFFGFSLTKEQAKADPGWFFVIEERISESRFAFDMATAPESEAPADTDQINWGHIPDLHEGDKLRDDVYLNGSTFNSERLPPEIPDWNESSASIAWITHQKPVRIAVHASRMIPEQTSD